ncbi:MAG: indolepyruvate ferredoxin oxidoreductase family protein [Gammaproteobacteria bacterium]|nr:indolepyruvate ferredoxin oxidoreductase family protein [Gammaproteobacteria bacterium]
MHAKASLDDRYTRTSGTVLLSGLQALVRLLVVQRQRDVAAGLNTAGFVSGYRGSPLGGLDQQLWRAAAHLEAHHVRFQPGVNEDLAATALWGSQQVNLFPGARYDGVFGLWYGKGPGVDRSGDVFRHANASGTSRHGGVLAVAGDDHAARSSTLPHQSEHAFMSVMMPVLHPAGVQDLLDYGVLGWAMSRYSGCWVALKATAELLDSSATVDADPGRVRIVLPDGVDLPADGLATRWPDWPLQQEARLQRHKVYAALAFAAANRIDRVVLDSPRPRIGIVTTGKSYLDVRQALDDLGIDEQLAAAIGLRVYKVGMPWPLEANGVLEFARGLEEVLVVEEKRPVIELQLKAQLYNWDNAVRPRVVGKFDEAGAWLLPAAGELTAGQVAQVIAARLQPFHRSDAVDRRLAAVARLETPAPADPAAFTRLPYFCSGCPHNTSTRVPAGSRAMAGIGCHYMALWMDRSTATFTQMGGEGAAWIGQAPFTATPHVFQNMGDGTYFHSGLLAIRAAVAARVNITYKILFNDAVAMTGGQPVDGPLTPARVAQQLSGEGVERIVLVSDHDYRDEERSGFPPGVAFHHRRELERLQRELREVPGVTVLIYHQMCAAEKRRRRRRGRLPEPPRRVFINELVCEGCGDCSTRSNCLSVMPVETEFGRKRAIDQDSCNLDYSCLDGFCPSFVTVHGGELRRPAVASADTSTLPVPVLPGLDRAWGVVIAGVGGTGVVTLSAVLGMAAHLEDRHATTIDQTGLAQKFGAVLSFVRIGARAGIVHAPRIPAGDADLLIGGDLLVGGGSEALGKLSGALSSAVVDADVDMPAAFIRAPDLALPEDALRAGIEAAVRPQSAWFLPAKRLAHALTGDSITAHFLLLGFAWQHGLVPIGEAAILEAIDLNGVAPERNRAAFAWGRRAAVDLQAVREAAGLAAMPAPASGLKAVVVRRAGFLEAYQDADYAHRYENLVNLVAASEAQLPGPARQELALAVARGYFRLLAAKDEYEVARLLTEPRFLDDLRARIGGRYRLHFHLAPPLLARIDPLSGRPAKHEFGPWLLVLLRLLRRLRFLRGTPFDPFRHSADRRLDRELLAAYERIVEELLDGLTAENHPLAVQLASLPEAVRGYGPIRAAAAARFHAALPDLMQKFRGS